MNRSDPAETFRLEAADLLEQLEEALLDLERSPDDLDIVDTAFRALHTLKGSGAMFGFEAAAAFTHHVETVFDQIRRLIEAADPSTVDGDEGLLERLHALALPAAAAPAVAAPATWRIRFSLPQNALVTGVNPLVLLDELRDLGPCTVVAQTDRLPALDALDPLGCWLGWDVVLTTDQPREAIAQVFIFVLDEMELKIDALEADERRLGEILVERGDVPAEAVEAAAAAQAPIGKLLVQAGDLSEERLAAALGEQQHLRAEARIAKPADTVRVPAERLDELMDRVGELVIAQSRLRQVAAASTDLNLKSVAEEIERLALDLRDTTMGVRMLPIGALFGRYRRLVFDLARELGKEIELETSGEDTELDKTVIDRLNDPLIHLIRNALDHGVEAPADRVELGKPAQGRIRLSARHAGAEVLVSITDDGRGLDREAIRARGEARGLIAEGQVLTDSELFQVIFQPGFSTAERVTSLSGRGVGMDVVKRTIESLRGAIDIASTPGAGTVMTLRLPLTLAIIDGLLVRVGEGRYVIPLSAVEECVELPPDEEARSRHRSFLNIRGALTPYLRLRELFDCQTPPDPYQKIVIVSAGGSRVGLVVDQVIGDHQTVIKTLTRLHADVGMFSGATILGDGAVALILEIAHLVQVGQAADEPLKAAV
ncbi:MAG TPA: chemotaxis protein CheA [Caulobacteraceae bacterium]|nr:chemotaxis protein CheA [Caulobacteraceae bacterium]